MRPFSVCTKIVKIRDFKVDFLKNFLGAVVPRPLMERATTAPLPRPPWRFEPPAPHSWHSVPPSALPGNKADLWMHCLILRSGAATVFEYWEDCSQIYLEICIFFSENGKLWAINDELDYRTLCDVDLCNRLPVGGGCVCALQLYFCLFLFFFRPPKLWDNRSRERNGWTDFHETFTKRWGGANVVWNVVPPLGESRAAA